MRPLPARPPWKWLGNADNLGPARLGAQKDAKPATKPNVQGHRIGGFSGFSGFLEAPGPCGGVRERPGKRPKGVLGGVRGRPGASRGRPGASQLNPATLVSEVFWASLWAPTGQPSPGGGLENAEIWDPPGRGLWTEAKKRETHYQTQRSDPKKSPEAPRRRPEAPGGARRHPGGARRGPREASKGLKGAPKPASAPRKRGHQRPPKAPQRPRRPPDGFGAPKATTGKAHNLSGRS